MKIGDKVKRKHDDYDFDGVIIGEVAASRGRRFLVIEQNGTGFVQCFWENAMYPDDGFGWADTHGVQIAPVVPPPPPKLTLPFEVFVPVRAVPAAGMNKSKFVEVVRVSHLKATLRECLITEKINAAIEFHFKGLHVGDLDNLLKPTIDLLKGSVIRDDSQVMSFDGTRIKENMPSDGINIKLTPYVA